MAMNQRNSQSAPNFRTPVLEKANLFTASWQRYLSNLVLQVSNLVNGPTSLSGLFAVRPDATGQAENTTYYSTDTLADYINIYGTSGDPTTAAWVAKP